MNKNYLFVALALFLSLSATGQKEFDKADKLYKLKAFDLAIENYISALAKYPTHAVGYAKLANAYNMKNDLLSAVEAYEKALSLGVDLETSYRLQYAEVLKKVGLYDKAAAIYNEYAMVNAQDAAYHIMGINEAKKLLQESDLYEVSVFPGNSTDSDFGVAFFKDDIVFCSFRTDIKRDNEKKNDSYIQTTGSQLFKYRQSDVKLLRGDMKENYYLGPLSYSRDGRMVAFMRNTFSNGCTKIFNNETDMSIHLAMTEAEGDFSEAKPFKFNELSYAYGFPHLASAENALYFASNRPGGYGGFDLYVSYFNDGEWSEPNNLGAEINTPGNEITPFVNGGKLYFSSDRLLGLGGYDVFQAEKKSDKWSDPTNMGKGINSPADDFYFAVEPKSGDYYFTSNRLGGRGNDDIYLAYPLRRLQQEMLAVAEENMPEAVRIDEFEEVVPEAIAINTQSFIEKDVVAIPVSEEEIVTLEEDLGSLYDGAVLKSITMGRVPEPVMDENARYYFIQLAAYAQSNGHLSNFSSVQEYGKLFRFYKSSNVKIRLGHYESRAEADRVLAEVKKRGFKDAFVTIDILSSSTYDIISSASAGNSAGWINDYNPSTSFKVKLASYNNPLNFDIDKAIDLGRLEQWTKGSFTIFILGGYESYEAAVKAKNAAIKRGFKDAELIEDDNGIIKRAKN